MSDMNYRFVKITSYYRSFLENYYSRKKDIISEHYDVQLKDLMDEGFGWADFFKINMEKIGNEAYEIIWNVTAMQNAWAAEHGIKASGSDILFHQLKTIKPEIIFFQDSISFPGEFIKKIRREIPQVKLIIGWLCAPYAPVHLNTYREFDFVCGCSPEFTNYLTGKGIRSYELNHAFESTVLKKIDNSGERTTDLIFTGSFIAGSDYHDDRINLFEELLKEGIKIDIHTSVPDISWLRLKLIQGGYITSELLKKSGMEELQLKIPLLKKTAGLNAFPEKIRLSSEFRNSVKPPVYGYEMFRKLVKSKAGLNIHGGIAAEYAANSRMFELTGAGTVLITDYKKNIADFFVPDEEAVIYKSLPECKEKIKWLLNNNDDLLRIAAAGQKRTLTSHTYLDRIEKLNSIILSNLS